MPLGTEVGFGQGHIVLDAKRHSNPPLLVHVYYGQTAGWITIPLGVKVGLGPGDIVLDWDPAPATERGTAAPTFRPTCMVAKRLDGSGYHLLRR